MRPGRLVLAIAVVGLLAGAAPGAQSVDPDRIQPGDPLQRAACTLSFALDSTTNDTVYVLTAGHCVDENERVTSEGVEFGTVVYEIPGLDAALIEVDEEDTERVRAFVKGNPSVPTGYTTMHDTITGDPVELSGYGVPFDENPVTRENRAGVLVSDTSRMYRSNAVVSVGDSGGPLVHAPSGKALGVVSRPGVVSEADPTSLPANLVGPTIQGVLDTLDAHGWNVTLQTV